MRQCCEQASSAGSPSCYAQYTHAAYSPHACGQFQAAEAHAEEGTQSITAGMQETFRETPGVKPTTAAGFQEPVRKAASSKHLQALPAGTQTAHSKPFRSNNTFGSSNTATPVRGKAPQSQSGTDGFKKIGNTISIAADGKEKHQLEADRAKPAKVPAALQAPTPFPKRPSLTRDYVSNRVDIASDSVRSTFTT